MRALSLVITWIIVTVTWATADETVFDFAADDIGQWTPSKDVTLEKVEDGALLTIPEWTEGERQWPGISLTGRWDWSGLSRLVLDVANPMDRTQMIQMDLRGVGRPIGGWARLAPGESKAVTIDLATEGPLDVSAATDLLIFRTRPPFEQKLILRRLRLLSPEPGDQQGSQKLRLERAVLSGQRVLSQAAQAEADAIAPHKRTWWEVRLRATQREAADLVDALERFDEVCRGHLLELRERALRFRAQAAALKLATSADLILWKAPPWEQVETITMPPDDVEVLKRIDVSLAGSEIEDRAINITNVSGKTLTILVRSERESPLAPSVEFFLPTAVRARDGSQPMDALVPLNSAPLVTVPAGETRQVWIRVNTKKHRLRPGKYELMFDFMPLEAPGLRQAVKLGVERWPFDLPDGSPLKICTWAQVFTGRSRHVIGDLQEEAVDMLVEAGVNTFVFMPNEWPHPKFTADGKLEGKLDFALHDERIQFYRGRGKGQVLIILGVDMGLWNELKFGTDAWRRALSEWMGAWRAHLHGLGLSENDFAFYLVDEPNESAIRSVYLGFGGELKKIWPEARIYLNGATYLDNPQERKRLFQIADIVQVEIYDAIGADKRWLPTLQREIREPWMYTYHGGRSRSVNLYDNYLLPAWKAVAWGLDGIGFWSFCASHNEDPWDGLSEGAAGLIVVYPGTDRLIESRRWAAYREGIEGAKLAAIAAAKGKAGQRLVDEAASDIVTTGKPERLDFWRRRLAEFVLKTSQ